MVRARRALPLSGTFGDERSEYNERSPVEFLRSGSRKAAAAYSPTWWGSTIGAGAFNFSVRDGKRWFHTAITAAVYYLREINTTFKSFPVISLATQKISGD